MTVFAREYCFKHQVLRPAGEQCGQCAVDAVPYCDIHDLIYAGAPVCPACASQQRQEAVNVLEARIADLEAENLDLRRRVTALEHLVQL